MSGNPRLKELMNADIFGIVSDETELKTESANNGDVFNLESFSNNFKKEEEVSILENKNSKEEIKEIEPEKPYNARANASSLVYGLQAVESITLTPVGVFKVKKSVGGKKSIEKMRASIKKQFEGEELTKKDLNRIKAFKEYERKMNLLSDSFSPNPTQTQTLIELAIPYCEETKLNVGKGTAFWGAYAGGVVEKITKILLT